MTKKTTETIDSTQTSSDNQTDALIRHEYRRKAFCGLDRMCQWDFAHDSGENPSLTETGLQYVCNFPELQKDGVRV